ELANSKLRFVHIRHEALEERSDVSQTALDYAWQVVGQDAPLHAALDEVGFTDELRMKPVCELSGGWRVRLLLATAVARAADVLLLDEPTNHLDSQAVSWLVSYLNHRKSTSVVVSHDALFLDQICTDIIHFDECQLKYYRGNFSVFQQQAPQFHPRDLLKVRSESQPEMASVRKAVPTPQGGYRMALPVPGKVEGLTSIRKPVLELKDVSFRYLMAKDYTLKHVSGKVTTQSRIAIVGPNGSGKSTLLSLICGELRPCADETGQVGEVQQHRSLRLAYVAQSHAFHLADYAKCTAEEYIQVRYRNGYDEELQKRLLAPPDDAEATLLQRLGARFGKYGKQVEAVVSRRKQRNDWRYEVKWQDLAEKQNTFESIGKLRQLGVERFATALDERLAVGVDSDDRPLTRREIQRHLEGFGLSEDLSTKQPISQLSGGQKSKLLIAAAAWTKPHVLCLDEPTNFLDFETVDALSRALRSFRGGVLLVSHNQEFLSSICEESWHLEDQQVAPPTGRSELRVLELFAGLGGMRCALAQAKLPVEVKIVAAIDVSELCEKAYCHNFGHAEWKKKTIECLKLQEVDALAADLWLMSPPCQPFTRAGKRKDHEDDRSRGLLHLISLLPLMENPPRAILLENVVGFERSECRQRLLDTLAQLEHWELAEFALDPEEFGLPNRRPRYYGLFRASEGAPGLGRLQVSLQDGGCFWRPVATALEAEALLQGRAGPLTEVTVLGDFLQDAASVAMEEEVMGCSIEVPQEVMRTRQQKEQRYDIHLRSDRTSACLTKANGRLPFGHSPLVLQNEEEECGLQQRPKLSAQGDGAGSATDHVWEDGLRVRYLSPVEQLRLLGFPESYVFPAALSFKDCQPLRSDRPPVRCFLCSAIAVVKHL
ncbi:[NU+] prion formation protein 1, partial [Durusdinium trenchii]